MFKYTKHSLKKLETLLDELEYAVRYEKGNFQSGYCLVEHKKIAVVNKFYDTEGRINCLLDILSQLDFQPDQLSAASAKFYRQITTLSEEGDADDAPTDEVPTDDAELAPAD